MLLLRGWRLWDFIDDVVLPPGSGNFAAASAIDFNDALLCNKYDTIAYTVQYTLHGFADLVL